MDTLPDISMPPEAVKEDLAIIETEDLKSDPFVRAPPIKPAVIKAEPKPKRQISEKQKAHLANARKLARERKAQKKKRRRTTEQRAYAEGLQSSTKYKDLMNKSGDDSYLNLDWSIVPIVPKFVDIIVGSMTNQDYKIACTAIDPISTQKRKDDKLFNLLELKRKGLMTI